MKKIFMFIKKYWMFFLILLVIVILSYSGIMFYYSKRSEPFKPIYEANNNKVPGTIFIDTVITLVDNELNSVSGWVVNDIFPSPGYFLDNRQNEQLGFLIVLQHTVYQLNENLSRNRSTDKIVKNLNDAKNSFFFAPDRLILPSTESKYREGIEFLKKYREDLVNGTEHFSARADALVLLLNDYISKLGGLTNKLRSAITELRFSKNNAYSDDKIKKIDISFFEIDDVFYEAQGFGKTLYSMLHALKYEFNTILKDKQAEDLYAEILFLTDSIYFEPFLVMNGDMDSLLIPNHLSNINMILLEIRMKLSSLTTMLSNN